MILVGHFPFINKTNKNNFDFFFFGGGEDVDKIYYNSAVIFQFQKSIQFRLPFYVL